MIRSETILSLHSTRNRVRARWSVWRALLGLMAFGLILGVDFAPRAQEPAASEYQVKAAWLLNFARFVEWPGRSFGSPRAPFVVGVVGRDPFGKDLEQAFAGKTVRGRAFEFRHFPSDSDLHGCHILFFGKSERRRIRDQLSKIGTVPVLTVGEDEDFLEEGGIVNFLLKDRSIRFEINLKAAQAAELKLDANLLKVAVEVRGKYD
jgi:hypothetical protein